MTYSLTLILLIVFSDFISAVSKGLCKVIKTSKKVILIGKVETQELTAERTLALWHTHISAHAP